MMSAAIKHVFIFVLVFETVETNKHSNEVAIITEGTFYLKKSSVGAQHQPCMHICK